MKLIHISSISLFLFMILFSCHAHDFKTLKIGSHILQVEIADTPEERQKGLMFRKALKKDRGMLFVFESEKPLSFWMKETRIPLSIAFISKSGIIKSIFDMEPYSLKPVESGFSVLYALEVNQGYFTEHAIHVGDQVILPRD